MLETVLTAGKAITSVICTCVNTLSFNKTAGKHRRLSWALCIQVFSRKYMLHYQSECWQVKRNKRILAFSPLCRRWCFRMMSYAVCQSCLFPVSEVPSTQHVLSARTVVRMIFTVWDICPELSHCLIHKVLGSVFISPWRKAIKLRASSRIKN